MKLLLSSEIKKGDTIYEHGAWNFVSFGIERHDHFHRVNGKGVYTPRTIDQAYVRKHVVHSCGKKRMYLMAEDGVTRGKEYNAYNHEQFGNIFGNFAASVEIAIANLEEKFANDKYSKIPHEILIDPSV